MNVLTGLSSISASAMNSVPFASPNRGCFPIRLSNECFHRLSPRWDGGVARAILLPLRKSETVGHQQSTGPLRPPRSNQNYDQRILAVDWWYHVSLSTNRPSPSSIIYYHCWSSSDLWAFTFSLMTSGHSALKNFLSLTSQGPGLGNGCQGPWPSAPSPTITSLSSFLRWPIFF